MIEQCPISPDTVGEKAARITAGLTLLLVAAYLAFGWVAVLLLLVVDFSSRAFFGGSLSALKVVAGWLGRTLRLEDKRVNAAPKVFAARLGFAMSLVAALLHLAGARSAAFGVIGVLGACASLEALAGYCVGCKIYSLLAPYLGRLQAQRTQA